MKQNRRPRRDDNPGGGKFKRKDSSGGEGRSFSRLKADKKGEYDDDEDKRKGTRGGNENKYKPQDRPYKAGTRPAGKNSFEKSDRGAKSGFGSKRRNDKPFDKQDRPYKAGTRPAGRTEGEKFSRDSRDEKFPAREKRKYGEKDFERRDSYNKSNTRSSRYGDKKMASDREKFSKSGKKDDGKIRLNKYIANSGVCSRREADEYIAAGVVTVNGATITEMGYKVSPGDVVKFHDKPLRSEKLVYVLLNKPKDFITTTDDDRDRRTVMNLLHGTGKERIYPVGRLDRSTTGVLLFTNDGELTKKLTHPSHEIKKIYQVELDKPLKPSDLEKIKEGIKLEDGVAEVDEIIYSGDTKKVVGMELHSGRNRIVRRIFESLDYRVVKLDRVYFAGLTKKDLSRGRWRFLNEMEISMLKMLTAKKPRRTKE